MGSGASTPLGKKEQQLKIPISRKGYPPPEPPKFYLPDLLKNDFIPEGVGTSTLDVGFEWSEIESIVQEGKTKDTPQKDAHTDYNKPTDDTGLANDDKANTDKKLTNGNESIAKTARDGGKDEKVVPARNGVRAVRPTQNNNSKKKKQSSKPWQTSTYHQKYTYISFEALDLHAKAASDEHSSTFSDLTTYLQSGITTKHYPDLYLARGLLVWLGSRPLGRLKPDTPSTTSPGGVLQHLKHGTLSFTSAYTLLCRGANLPCVLITGFVKVNDYQVGDVLTEIHEDTWCSVFVDHHWQLIHPLLVCRGVFKPGTADSVLIEKDPGRVPTKLDAAIGVFNEEFFMPKPEDFIFRCYALDIQWHLLPIQRTLKSTDEFRLLAFPSNAYFKLGLKLLSVPHSVQHSIEGVWMLELVAPQQFANRLRFAHTLTPLDVADKLHPFLKPSVIQRLILAYRSNEYFTFEIRLPSEGHYLFELQGGFEQLYNVLKFRIICRRAMRDLRLVPVNTDSLCFGPGPATEDVGLMLPSKPGGVLTLLPTYSNNTLSPLVSKDEETLTLTFQYAHECLKRFEYSAELIGSESKTEGNTKQFTLSSSTKVLTGSLICTADTKAKQLDLKLTVPTDGEYALIIKAGELIEKKGQQTVNLKSIKTVCYYFITTMTFREPTDHRLARTELAKAMDINDLTDIRRALAKCDKLKISTTDDDILAAKNRLEYLKLKHDISESVRRRNIPYISEVLRKVVNYKYRNCLVSEVKGLQEVFEELLTLDGYTQPTPPLRDAVEELYKTFNPLPETHNTLIAVGTLIGFEEQNMNNWGFVHSQLRITTEAVDHMNILRRIEYMESPSFPWLKLDRDSLAHTAAVLSKYTYSQVARASLPAAAFYKWVQQMLETAEAKFEEKERMRQERELQIKERKQAKRRRHREREW